MRRHGRLFNQVPNPATAVHPLFGSGAGFAPDIMSESGFATLPEASATQLEMDDPFFGQGRFEVIPEVQPPYGKQGMMPPASMETGPTQPGITLNDEGVGGSGTFLCANTIGARG